MDEYGTLDAGVTATGLSSYAAFDKGGTRTYVAYNYSTADQDVVFMDPSLPEGSRQVTVHVPARTLAYQTGTDPSGLKTHTIANLANVASPQKNVFYLTADGTTPGATNVFPTENGTTTRLTLKAGDGTQNGPPSDGSELSFIIDGLSGSLRSNLQPDATTLFDLWLNPGFLTSSANPAVSIQFEYDFGDGNFSRKEFFQPSGLTSKLTAFEQWLRYDENVGTVSAQGDWKDFEAGKGRIRVTVWVSIGTQDIRLSTSTIASLFRQSRFEIPFDGVSVGG